MLEHTSCGELTHAVMTCDHCHEELTTNLRARRGPGATDDSLMPR
ncbi:MAG: hypothetical protein ACSLFP_09620 [Acidimicrobiales bacterium]